MDHSTTPINVLVAIGVSPSSERLLWRAVRLAQGLGGQLLAVHIHPPGAYSQVCDANVQWHLQQARDAGAQVSVIEGRDIAETLMQFGAEHGVTHLIMGQSDVSRWQEATRGSLVNKILRMRSGIDIYLAADEAAH